MTKQQWIDAGTFPAWCAIFLACGALLGLVAWSLSWVLAYVKAL